MNSEKKRKTADLLGICLKAGKAVKGFDSAMEEVKNGNARCVLTAFDVSPKTFKEAMFSCGRRNVRVYATELTKAELGKLCGKDTGVLAICDPGFAKGFAKILD